jgi:hypothetical protein
VSDPASPAGNGNHPVAFEDIADGGSAWKIPKGMAIMYDLEDLFTAPRGMLVPYFQEHIHNLGISFVGGMTGFSGKVLEGAWSIFDVTFDPFVSGLAGYLITLAKLSEREYIF